MKLTAQATIIEGITHSLFSPQWGTTCGIRHITKEENILDITELDEITCPECLKKMHIDMNLLCTMMAGRR